jgi:XTP/dITP diphosphohydrolase
VARTAQCRLVIYTFLKLSLAIKIWDPTPSNGMADARNSLLVATTNRGKLTEVTELLSLLSFDLVALDQIGLFHEVPEIGQTFAENASLKACGYAEQHMMLTIADDSGLEVTALGGRPGVRSARYGGPDADFDIKMRLLLSEMSGVTDRSARFVCAVALASAEGKIVAQAEGTCDGHITHEPRGDRGFGYDPVFVPRGFDLTFGELPPKIKQRISHRSRAFADIIPFLRGLGGILT